MRNGARMSKLQEACDALLARQEPDGSWPPTSEREPARPASGWPPELAFLSSESPATRAPRAILAGRRRPWTPFRGRSEAACVNWLLDHLHEVDAGLGLQALRALRFPDDHPAVSTLRERYGALARVEATAEAVIALQEAGLPPERLQTGVAFLLAHPTQNVTITSKVLLALNRARQPELAVQQEAIRSQMEWLLNQQRPDGSWVDTATVLETLRWYGYTNQSPRVQRALRSRPQTRTRPRTDAEGLRSLAIQLQEEGHLVPPPTAFR